MNKLRGKLVLLLLVLVLVQPADAARDFDIRLFTTPEKNYEPDNQAFGGFSWLGVWCWDQYGQSSWTQIDLRVNYQVEIQAETDEDPLGYSAHFVQMWNAVWYWKWMGVSDDDYATELVGGTDGWENDPIPYPPQYPPYFLNDITVSPQPQGNIYLIDAPGTRTNVWGGYFVPGDEWHFKANFKTWVEALDGTRESGYLYWHLHIKYTVVAGPSGPTDPMDVYLKVVVSTDVDVGTGHIPVTVD